MSITTSVPPGRSTRRTSARPGSHPGGKKYANRACTTSTLPSGSGMCSAEPGSTRIRGSRRGHAYRMLAGALVYCAHFGLDRVPVTCDEDNVASRKVIEANGGEPDGIADGELRYWITTPGAG